MVTKGEVLVAVAEDNPEDEAMIVRSLKKLAPNAVVIVARDGVEALEMLCGPTARVPDLVLTDLKMPRLDGCDVVRQLRSVEAFEAVPIVVFSSSDNPTDAKRATDAGCTMYVTKPVDYHLFGVVMGSILEQSVYRKGA